MMGHPFTRFIAASLLAVALLPSLDARAGDTLQAQAEQARAQFTDRAPAMAELFQESHAYALFPRVKKGAAGIGGARGRGLVYRGGKPVAQATVSQATVGFQLGGKVYSQVIFFEDAAAFDDFTNGSFELSAQASATAAAEGVAANADYRHGVAIYTMSQGGLMVEASVGGQKFAYYPL